MAYGLAMACGAALAALLVGGYWTRGAGSPVARLLRRAGLFLAPLFLVALLFSLHHYRLQAAVDIVRPAATIGELEDAIARVDMAPALRAAVRGANGAALAAGLLVLAALAFVRPRTPRLGLGRGAAAGAAVAYAAAVAVLAGALLGQGVVRDIDDGVARLRAHVDDIERKARDYRRDVEAEARAVVREALLHAMGAASMQARLDAARAALGAAREEIAPYRELLQPVADGFRGATLEADFADTWRDIRSTVDTLHWDRRPAESVIPRAGRSAWSTLRLYEAGTDLRNDRLSRPKVELADLHDVVAKTFDVVFSAAGRTALDAALDVDHGYPLAPLVASLVDVWHEPLQPLVTAQAEALFDATVVQGQPFADAAAGAQARVRAAMTPLEADLRPGLDQVARRLQRLQGEAARLPQSFRRFAAAALPQRLQAFRASWHRLLSFSSPAAARAAAALQRKAEAALDALPDPLGRHERLAAYERALQTLARGVNDPARYQVLLRLEQRHFDSRDFARFTRSRVETRLAAAGAPGNGRPPPGQALAQLEARSQWLQAHRLALRGLLQEAGGDWRAGDRDRVLGHLAFDLRFLVRAITQGYKPETYTPDVLRDRIRAYGALAAALEPAALARDDFIDSAFGNLTGSSARGALRFQVVDLIARAEARLRLAPSAATLPLADLLRAERNLIAVYQNASEDRYVQALLGLWQEADRQPERGARISALALAGLEDDSRRLKAPAQGALRALRRLVQRSQETALALAGLRRDLARADTPDAGLGDAFATTRAQFLALQAQIRHDWAHARRRVHIRGAQRSR